MVLLRPARRELTAASVGPEPVEFHDLPVARKAEYSAGAADQALDLVGIHLLGIVVLICPDIVFLNKDILD